MDQAREIKEFVRDRYGEIASSDETCCPGCSCGPDPMEQAMSIGYSRAESESVPAPAVMGLGCGNPTALADLREGETVLDLGSGGGLDVFLAAQRVGRNGHVIGVDMTREMIERARRTAKLYAYENAEFRLGEIENLPVESDSIDVIISNCVVNLSPDKAAVYREAFRVLKPGGRMMISDLVTAGELPEEIRRSFEAWAECVAGALEREAYLETIRRAGFQDIAIVAEHAFDEPGMSEALKGKIISVQVKAHKTHVTRD
jgi:SAM-dependent methyltransferase